MFLYSLRLCGGAILISVGLNYLLGGPWFYALVALSLASYGVTSLGRILDGGGSPGPQSHGHRGGHSRGSRR